MKRRESLKSILAGTAGLLGAPAIVSAALAALGREELESEARA